MQEGISFRRTFYRIIDFHFKGVAFWISFSIFTISLSCLWHMWSRIWMVETGLYKCGCDAFYCFSNIFAGTPSGNRWAFILPFLKIFGERHFTISHSNLFLCTASDFFKWHGKLFILFLSFSSCKFFFSPENQNWLLKNAYEQWTQFFSFPWVKMC